MGKVLAKLVLSIVLGSLLFAIADAIVVAPWRLRHAAAQAGRGAWTVADAKAAFGPNCTWGIQDQRIPPVDDYPPLIADDVATTRPATLPAARSAGRARSTSPP